MARIHLIDGEKGGVGKSLFARVILEDKPKELSGLFDRWSEAIYERLETAKRISLKGLEIEINQTARTLMQQEQLRW